MLKIGERRQEQNREIGQETVELTQIKGLRGSGGGLLSDSAYSLKVGTTGPGEVVDVEHKKQLRIRPKFLA